MNKIWGYLKEKDTENQKKLLYKIFKSYDKDNNNEIDKNECIELFSDFLKGLFYFFFFN
jgi:Ca2+-binding EF-hand superfamily protein